MPEINDDTLLDTCLNVTGHFEGGTPKYNAVTGNFDGQGMSAGILQWNLGQGTLQPLLKSIPVAEEVGAYERLNIPHLMTLSPANAIAYAKANYLSDGNHMRPDILTLWQGFLNSPASVAAQRKYAQNSVLAHAHKLAVQFLPDDAARSRTVAFFFDLVVQQGSMKDIQPVPSPDASEAMDFTANTDTACSNLWQPIVESDDLAGKLMYYAYERAKEGNPTYLWDTFSRRATIAARVGIVHKTNIDLTKILD